MGTDIHQHLWTEPLLAALAQRRELPFVSERRGTWMLHLAGESAYAIAAEARSAETRADLLEEDGVTRALLAPSCPLGIESLPRGQARPVLDAYMDGALALGEPFGAWGAIPLQGAAAEDVDSVLDRGCVGLCLPADALAGVAALARLHGVLRRLEERDAPLLVHPGSATRCAAGEACLQDPVWWPALTSYVGQMQAAWLAFAAAGRRAHPRLRVVFALLAGGAPLQVERLHARGGPNVAPDPLTFYEISSYGPRMIDAIADAVGRDQLVYGSDRPLADVEDRCPARSPLMAAFARNSERALRREVAA